MKAHYILEGIMGQIGLHEVAPAFGWGDAIALAWLLALFISWAFFRSANREGYTGEEVLPVHPPGRCMNPDCHECLDDTHDKLCEEIHNSGDC